MKNQGHKSERGITRERGKEKWGWGIRKSNRGGDCAQSTFCAHMKMSGWKPLLCTIWYMPINRKLWKRSRVKIQKLIPWLHKLTKVHFVYVISKWNKMQKV
jgi:hypothetical protein